MEVKETILASERNFNLAISMIKNAPRKKIEFPVTTTFKKGLRQVSCSWYWDELCFQVLDFIVSKALKDFYIVINGGTIPKNPYEQCTQNNAMKYPRCDKDGNIINEIIDDSILSIFKVNTIISEKEFRAYKPFKKVSPNKFRDTLKMINNCKFSLNYPVRVLNGEKYISKEVPIDNESICEISVINEIKSNNGRILDRKYSFHFNTILGKLFMYNACMLSVDWIPLSFCDLKPKTQIFFRKVVGPYNNKKVLKVTYYFSDLNSNLNFEKSFVSDITKCVIELKKFGLIRDYKIKDNLIRIEFKKKSEIIEKISI